MRPVPPRHLDRCLPLVVLLSASLEFCACSSSSHATGAPTVDGGTEPKSGDAASTTDAASPGRILGTGVRGDLAFELRKALPGPGAPFASVNYLCPACGPNDVAAYESATIPSGFEREALRETLAARAILRALPDAQGEPRELDVLSSVPGAEFQLGAAPQGGKLLEGKWALVDLHSDRTLQWDAGDEIHEIFDGTVTYVAFLVERGTDPKTLEALPLPTGWTHSVRTLDAPLSLDAHGLPHVFLSLSDKHLWQRVE